MRRGLLIFLFPVAALAQPVCTAWIRSPQMATASASLARVLPEVHEVTCGDASVAIRSAGTSLYQFGLLANPVNPGNGVRDVRVRLPRHPQPETGTHAALPSTTTGLFVNGVPIDNHLESDSFEARNLWHYDLIASAQNGMSSMLAKLLNDGSKHSPLIGFALDGYPIYGPWGNGDGTLKRLRSSYKLRSIKERTSWADGTQLTPGQYGPRVDSANPIGTFSEDYEFVQGSGDLDRFNGRFAVTPEYPEGTYAYFISTDPAGDLAYPYLMADEYYGHVEPQIATPITLATRHGFVLKASSAAPAAGSPITFRFEETARALEYVHERPIHLIVVSSDLSDFSHIHPERDSPMPGNSYQVTHTFSGGGHYRLYAEFTAPGEGPRIESFDVNVAGTPKLQTPQTSGTLHADLSSATPLRAGRDEILTFRLNTTAGLEPYLGAWGHFVVIENGLRSFIHAHPMQTGQIFPDPAAPHQHNAIPLAEPPPDKIEVPVVFPNAGVYKLWAQFQVNGEVQVIPFTLHVEPNVTHKQPAVVAPKDAIHVRVSASGFVPARIETPAGKPFTLAISRDTQPNCASKIVIPELNITRDLPPGGTAIVNMPAMASKELRFACGMGMLRGLIVVK